MTTQSRIVLAFHRALVRTSQTPLGWVWRLAYHLIARAWVAYLAWGEPGAAAYLRGGSGAGDVLPGVSDIDVAIVLPADPAGEGVASRRARERWQRLRRRMPATDLLLDYPRIYDDEELGDVIGKSALTYGLDGRGADPGRAAYFGAAGSPDRIRMLERPGLYGATDDWRLLTGPDRRPSEPPRDPQARRIAAWLELLHWWEWAFPVCLDPKGPRTAALCVKLVAEPARILLWLGHGERASGRGDVLARALRRMPEEEHALRLAIDLNRALPRSPSPPLNDVLPVLVRLSTRIAQLIEAEIDPEDSTEVRLVGADPPELVLPHGCEALRSIAGGADLRLLPLCDWRALAWPRRPDQAFAAVPGDPGDPAVLSLATAVSDEYGPYPVLRTDGLMILPGATHPRAKLRALQCRATDPVSFALERGDPVASFPSVRGWSAEDTARRAVSEHRARLLAAQTAWDVSDGRGGALGVTLTAARAALFLETIRAGEPELAVTVAETARQLGARSSADRVLAEEALGCYRDFAARRVAPPSATVSAMHRLVLELPAYSDAVSGAGERSRITPR